MIFRIADVLCTLLRAAVLLMVLPRMFPLLIRVDGGSMQPSLQTGDALLVSPFRAAARKISRGDIVICSYPGRGSKLFVKRIVGIPGDVIRREKGVTFVNGLPLDADMRKYGKNYEPRTLGRDMFFCVGDNRGNSNDSRNWTPGMKRGVGPIPGKMIRAVALKRLLPRNSAGSIPEYEAPVWVPYLALPEPKEGDMTSHEQKKT